ncbi:Ankyrin-2 [Fusarium oxysporum f. sp. rapae]|uniref:Ankyrin-2 n=1 Tax=Fusarium oxysporum f. sp. rapae TaxID=485398 RepID=A0A8J5NQ10_FUSOX|nr:Ankyrin-2 [Fusarium oxysporum f. sp. rapae]
MKLLTLPHEVIVLITSYMLWENSAQNERDLARLANTCHQLHRVVNPILYRQNRTFSGSSALLWAVERDIPEVVANACDAGTDLERCYGMPLLRCAAGKGHVRVIRELLQRCRLRFYDTKTAVTVALENDLAEVIQVLVDNGLDPSKPIDSMLKTYLHQASELGAVKSVAVMLKAGANVSARHHIDGTPLYFAAIKGKVEVIKLLMEHGADAGCLGVEDYSPLAEAVRRNQPLAVEAILQSSRNTGMTKSKAIPASLFYAAAASSSPTLIKLLLQHGANPNIAPDGRFPLTVAAEYGNVEMVKVLLECGVDIDAQYEGDDTPLHMAMKGNHPETIMVLIEAGANVSSANRSGLQPLHMVPQCDKSAEIIDALLAKGADLSAVSNDGLTILQSSAEVSNFDVVRLLLERGANPKLSSDRTLLLASRHGQEWIVEHLLNCGCDLEMTDNDGCTPLLAAAQFGSLKVVRMLLIKGANIKATNKSGCESALLAAIGSHADIIRELLGTGNVDPDQQDLDGRTALFYAVMLGHQSVVEALLTHHSPPALNTTDRYGATPFIMAARNGHLALIEHLLPFVNQWDVLHDRDNWGQDALYWAALCKNPQVKNRLESYARDLGMDARSYVGTPIHPHALFTSQTCYCDVCGRCTIHGVRGRSQQCHHCVCAAGGQFLICSSCSRAGAKCRDAGHIWNLYECENGDMSAYDSDSESTSESEEEPYDSDGADREQN